MRMQATTIKDDTRDALDLSILFDVFRTPFATARQLRDIYYRDMPLTDVRNALRRLLRRGHVIAIPYRDRNEPASASRYFVSQGGTEELELAKGWDEEQKRGGLFMASRKWQRWLYAHLDTVTLTYNVVAALGEASGLRLHYYIPREGTFDALILREDIQRNWSVGIVRKGMLVDDRRFLWLMEKIRGGEGNLTWHDGYHYGRRGAGMHLIVVGTEFEKAWVWTHFAPGSGQLSASGLLCAVATEEEAARGVWTNCFSDSKGAHVPFRTAAIVSHKPYPTEWQPRLPPYKAHHTPLPAEKLPPTLTPVQSRALDALFKWPLIRPTEVPPVIGTRYGVRYLDHVRGLRERGFVQDPNELLLERWRDYDPDDLELLLRTVEALEGEYRNRPQLLTDKGLRFLCARDRVQAEHVLKRWGTVRRDEDTGPIRLGGDIRKLLRELAHTTGVNALVSRICSELTYTPDALPDHLSRRYYKGRAWRQTQYDEYRPPTSIAPDAAILLKAGSQRRTVLLEYERQATRGGQALTRKLLVWINYAGHGIRVYQGAEVVAFVVPSESSRDLLAQRYRDLIRDNPAALRRRPPLELVVATESEIRASDRALGTIWTFANDPAFGKVALDLG